MSPNNTRVVERYRMANLPPSDNAKLRELKSKVDELFSLAEVMEEYYNDYWDDYEEDDNLADFNEESGLLLKVLERLAAQEELELLWGITTYAIGKFLDSSNAEMDSVQDFVKGLSEHFLEAVHELSKPVDEVLDLFLGWEDKGQNFSYGAISDILKGLPAEIRDKMGGRRIGEVEQISALPAWRPHLQ